MGHGLNVAELAKSFGRLGNSPKAYAASATSFPDVHAIPAKAMGVEFSSSDLSTVIYLQNFRKRYWP